MLAVSDTSPLGYLIVVEQAELLARLFDTVFIPPVVVRKLITKFQLLLHTRYAR